LMLFAISIIADIIIIAISLMLSFRHYFLSHYWCHMPFHYAIDIFIDAIISLRHWCFHYFHFIIDIIDYFDYAISDCFHYFILLFIAITPLFRFHYWCHYFRHYFDADVSLLLLLLPLFIDY
jgi:hypothetical protein